MERSERLKTEALDNARRQVIAVAAARTDLERFIARAMHWGATWSEIADVLGVSRQSAHQRYRTLRYNPTDGNTWHEPALPF